MFNIESESFRCQRWVTAWGFPRVMVKKQTRSVPRCQGHGGLKVQANGWPRAAQLFLINETLETSFFNCIDSFERERETSICGSTYVCIHWLLSWAVTGDWTCNLDVSGQQTERPGKVGAVWMSGPHSQYLTGSWLWHSWFFEMSFKRGHFWEALSK